MWTNRTMPAACASRTRWQFKTCARFCSLPEEGRTEELTTNRLSPNMQEALLPPQQQPVGHQGGARHVEARWPDQRPHEQLQANCHVCVAVSTNANLTFREPLDGGFVEKMSDPSLRSRRGVCASRQSDLCVFESSDARRPLFSVDAAPALPRRE